MKRWLGAAAVAALAIFALAGPASADIQRYQTQTGTMTVTLAAPYGYVHVFTIALDPCGGSFTGNASATNVHPSETISGTLMDGNLTFTSRYDGSSYFWTYSGPMAGGAANDSDGLSFGITVGYSLASSSWKNHGAYVTAQGGGSEAAQSCIGMPIAWSQTGTIDSHSPLGTTVALPDVGSYRISVSGTYANDGLNVADAEYTSVNGWATHLNGYDIPPWILGEGFGDVQINTGFVDWGTYNVNHTYSLTTPLAGGTVNLRAFDGDSNTNAQNTGWYSDNSGLLSYSITYLNQ